MKEQAKKVAVMMLWEVVAKWFIGKRRPKKWRSWCCEKLRPSVLHQNEGQKSGGHDVARSSGQVFYMKEKAKKVAVMMLREVTAKWFTSKRRPKKWRSWCREKFRQVFYIKEKAKKVAVMMLREVAAKWFRWKRRPKKWLHWFCKKWLPSGSDEKSGQKSGGHDVARSCGQVFLMKEKAKKVAVMMLREVAAKWFRWKRRPKKWRTWCCKKWLPSGSDERTGQKSGGHDVVRSGCQVVYMKE
jgi:hypothetical protein